MLLHTDDLMPGQHMCAAPCFFKPFTPSQFCTSKLVYTLLFTHASFFTRSVFAQACKQKADKPFCNLRTGRRNADSFIKMIRSWKRDWKQFWKHAISCGIHAVLLNLFQLGLSDISDISDLASVTSVNLFLLYLPCRPAALPPCPASLSTLTSKASYRHQGTGSVTLRSNRSNKAYQATCLRACNCCSSACTSEITNFMTVFIVFRCIQMSKILDPMTSTTSTLLPTHVSSQLPT